jgi:glycosyltransferase involved in cell wall biosynthesis
MKILWLSHLVPYPPKGGALQRSYYLLREAAKFHDIYLLAFIQHALLRNCFPDPDNGLEIARSKLSEFCVDVEFVPIPCEREWLGKERLMIESLFTSDPYTINWLKAQAMDRAIERLSDRLPFDGIHFDTISLAPYRRYFSQYKTVLTHHNIESHMILRRAENERNWLRKCYLYQEGWKLRQYEQKVCPQFSVNITCSRLDTERLLGLIPELTIAEIPNGVDLEYFKPSHCAEVPDSLVFAGRLDAYPNRKAVLYIAEEIWPLLKQEIPKAVVDIVGANPPSNLVGLAEHENNFRVHGFVEDVRPYLDRASLYVCPIRDGGGTKLKILDALAMEKAIVADPIACEGIDVKDGESVLFASTPQDYVACVKMLLRNPRRRKELGRNGRRLVQEKYAYGDLGRKLAEILGEVRRK